MKIPNEESIIANVVKHAPDTSIAIGHKVTIRWIEEAGLWAVKLADEYNEAVGPSFTAKTISEVITYLIEKDLLPDVAFGQVHIDSNVKVQPMPIPIRNQLCGTKQKNGSGIGLKTILSIPR
jgi:hypothetical protein